jgi:hypothetical protein
MSSGEPQFLVLGHSSETVIPYEERKKIPQGYTLLLLSECDKATGTEDVNRAIELAMETPLVLAKFRVYREDDPYPDLQLSLLSDFYISKTSKGKHVTAIQPSGVYLVPLNREEVTFREEYIQRYWQFDEATGTSIYRFEGETLRIPNSTRGYKTYKKSLIVNEDLYEKNLVEFQFENTVYPPKSELKDILNKTQTLDELKKSLTIRLEDLFKKLGPGLYIVPTCRSIKLSADIENAHNNLFEYIEREVDPELGEKLTLRHNFNRLKYRKQKLEFLNSLKNNPKLQVKPWKNIYTRVRNDLKRTIQIVENTRSKSALKQRGGKTKKIKK